MKVSPRLEKQSNRTIITDTHLSTVEVCSCTVHLEFWQWSRQGLTIIDKNVSPSQRERERERERERNQGTKEPWNQGTREPGNTEPGNQGTREPRNQGTRGHGTSEPVHRGTKEPGTQRTRNPGTREPGDQGTKEPEGRRRACTVGLCVGLPCIHTRNLDVYSYA